MTGESSGYVGSIPQHYDRNLGPLLFTEYAADIAHRVARLNPRRVLETAAGTGIVTRALRDALPATASLTATDLNAPMLDIAATKFRPGEAVEFRAADAMALPFDDASFDAIVCQFGRDVLSRQGQVLSRGLSRVGRRRPLCLQHLGLASP